MPATTPQEPAGLLSSSTANSAAQATPSGPPRPTIPLVERKLTTIDHAPEYGAAVALSPDGTRIAYVALPASGAAAIDAPAEVWVMDRNGRNRKRLAGDADLPVAPVWSPDGLSVVFRRSDNSDAAGHFQLVRVTTDGAETTLVDSTDGLLPVGFAPDGSLYFVRLSTAGTDLGVRLRERRRDVATWRISATTSPATGTSRRTAAACLPVASAERG